MAQVSRRQEAFCLITYAVLLLITLSTIAATYTNYPLLPFRTDSLSWSNAWLIAYAINYYGLIFAFCGIVVASEASWRASILWMIGCLIIGSPACCLYVFLWLTKEGGTLRLERESCLLPTVQQRQQHRHQRQHHRQTSADPSPPRHGSSSSYTPSKAIVSEVKDDAATTDTPSSSTEDSTNFSPPPSPPQRQQQLLRLQDRSRCTGNLHHQILYDHLTTPATTTTTTTRHNHHVHPVRRDVDRAIIS